MAVLTAPLDATALSTFVEAATIVSPAGGHVQAAGSRNAEDTGMVASASPSADLTPLEASEPESVAVPIAAVVHVSAAPHVMAIAASSSLASMTVATLASPLNALGFQVSATSIGLQVSAKNQRLADQFFQSLVHAISNPSGPTFASMVADFFGPVLDGQVLPLQSTADSLDYINWDEISRDLELQAADDLLNCCGRGNTTAHQPSLVATELQAVADPAILDQCFLQMGATTDQTTEDE